MHFPLFQNIQIGSEARSVSYSVDTGSPSLATKWPQRKASQLLSQSAEVNKS